MQNKFSIGEMSKLMNIPVKTLRYYDEIGLFKPIAVNKQNGYRYYSTEQFEQLDTIKYLRLLGIPLKEIKNHFRHRQVEYFLQLLKKQEQATVNKIRELESIKRRFENRIRELEEALTVTSTETVLIKQFPERQILCLTGKISSEPDLEMSLRKLEKLSDQQNSQIFIGKVGLTVAEDNLYKKNFHEYNSIFILPDEPFAATELIKTLPAGEYACIYYHGSHSDSRSYYEMVLAYAARHGYVLAGDSLERTIIDQFISKNKERFLTEIQIPVKKAVS